MRMWAACGVLTCRSRIWSQAVKDLTPPAPAPVVPVVPVAAVAVAPPSRSEAVAVEAVEVTGPLATTWRQPGPSPSEADA
jgi:hypothetical protein